jgi:hypothetical protein
MAASIRSHRGAVKPAGHFAGARPQRGKSGGAILLENKIVICVIFLINFDERQTSGASAT